MPYANTTAISFAGEVGKGGLANAKTTSEENTGETALKAGRFVALSDKGVKALNAKTDVLAGVVVRSTIYDQWEKGKRLDVMHLNAGDSIWVEIAKGVNDIARGDKVHVVAVPSGEKLAGTIQKTKDTNNTIETDLVVITVAGNLAEISKL